MPEQPGTLAAALIALQARLPRITKDETAEVDTKTGRKYSYRYASLASIHEAVFPLLAEFKFTWVCTPTLREDGRFVLAYCLGHISGERPVVGEYPLPEAGGSQALGSAITYARRYALCAVLGIVADADDDGQAAEDAAADWRPPANPRTRKADRHHAARSGQLPDDDWTLPANADEPGTINGPQRARLMAAFGKAGISAREDRLAYAMSRLNLPELETSNNLSMRQAGQLIAYLESESDT